MEILLLFSVVAFLYASVGHGGASGYIALMAIFAFPQTEIKTNALFLNIFVSFISFTQFFKKEEFPFNLFFILIIFSIPMAFLGGMWTLDNKWYKIILGLILFIPIVKFFRIFSKNAISGETKFIISHCFRIINWLTFRLIRHWWRYYFKSNFDTFGLVHRKTNCSCKCHFHFCKFFSRIVGKEFCYTSIFRKYCTDTYFHSFWRDFGWFFWS